MTLYLLYCRPQAKYEIQFMLFYLDKFSNRQFSEHCAMTKIIIKMFVFCFTFFLASAISSIACPRYSWTEYKSVVEGPWSFVIERDSGKPTVEGTIRRYTEYRCSDGNEVEFRTSRNGTASTTRSVLNEYKFLRSFSESCEQECNSKNVILQVKYRNRRPNSIWYLLGEVAYLYKNCDKLYWTNWIETTNCNSSRNWDYVRHCENCDRDKVDEKYCDGNSTVQEDCQPVWGEWNEEGPCVVTGCNPTTGERVKRRKCLYGDGSETINYELCSNNSEIVTEQCTNNTLPNNCTADTSSATESDNTSLYEYIGIGVALVLIVILCLLLAVVLYRRQKYRTNSTPNQNPSTLELSVARSIATGLNVFGREQSVVPNRYDYGQMPRSHEYELEKPVGRPIYENSEPEFSKANDLGQLSASHAYELEQSVVPNAYECDQQEELNEYKYASSMPHGANPPALSLPTYSTVQKHGKSTEESNEYSSLTRTIPVAESEYARLSPR